MGHEDYKKTLEAAKAEMNELLRQRNEIDSRIGKLAPVVEYLSALCDELPGPPPEPPIHIDVGLTDAIRQVFNAARPASLTPTEVRDKLRESGFNLDRYANELPPIHNTINRLLKNGEIEEDVPRREGKCYKRVSTFKRALLEIEPNIYGGARMGRLKDMIGAQLQTEQAILPPDTKKESWISRATKK